jgi:competence protein ComEA
MSVTISKLARKAVAVAAVAGIIAAMGGTWMTSQAASAAPATTPAAAAVPAPATHPNPKGDEPAAKKSTHKELAGKLNLNTATEEQLMLLPTVGPAKADRVVAWRKKNGGFKRIADLRRVKGFGYKTFKRLEPFLDIKGDTTLAQK